MKLKIIAIYIISALTLSSTLFSMPLSTNKDGSFQAISLSPARIDVFSLNENKIYISGTPLKPISKDKNGYNRFTADNLRPDTLYNFTLKDGTTIAEKTPCDIMNLKDADIIVIGATASGVSCAVRAAAMASS